MTVDDVLLYFGSVYAASKALNTSWQRVGNWKKRGYVPYKSQMQIEALTAGALKANYSHTQKGAGSMQNDEELLKTMRKKSLSGLKELKKMVEQLERDIGHKKPKISHSAIFVANHMLIQLNKLMNDIQKNAVHQAALNTDESEKEKKYNDS